MLSGFGICLSQKRPEKSFKSKIEFGKSKIKKIYPAYIVSLVVMLPCTYFGLRPYGSVINTGLKSLMLLGVDLSLLQSVTGMTFFSHSLNGVCWFLSCIFVCYIVMAFVIKKIDNIRSKREAEVCFLISIIIVLLLSLAASKIEQMNLSGGKINDLWYGHPAIRWWYLLIGAILGTLYKKTDIEFGTLTEVGITAVACVYFVLRNSLLEIMNQNFLRFFDLLLCSMVLLGFKGYSLEHLMPKKWRNNWAPCETEELAKKRDSCLLTLGNLAIIPQPLNASIRDANWTVKKAGKGTANPGLELCASGLLTIHDVLKELEWTEEKIGARADWLFEQAKRIWQA